MAVLCGGACRDVRVLASEGCHGGCQNVERHQARRWTATDVPMVSSAELSTTRWADNRLRGPTDENGRPRSGACG